MPFSFKSFHLLCLSLLFTDCGCIYVYVELNGPRYVSLGGSATLKCDYSVSQNILHKVEWFKGTHKIFQYVNGRRPPFRNFTIPGAELDWNLSDEKQVTLKKMDIDASGSYSCEVSTDSPIFTKESQDHDLTVVQVQQEEPRIWFGKPRYQEGEWLQVNCTTGPAQPPPHVTWLINDQKVDEWKVKMYRGAEGVRTAQLGLEIGAEHVGELKLTCLSTIPAYLGHHARHSDYADSKQNTIASLILVEVIGKPRVPPRPEVRPSSSQSASSGQGGNQGSSGSTSQSSGSKCRNQHANSKSSTSTPVSPILIILVLLFTDIR